MLYKEILQKNGIAEININDFSDESLLSIANVIGNVVPGDRGEIVQTLNAREIGEGPKGSFSYCVGYGEFPWHTDTAYWEVPARYLLLASEEASPCATTYQSFEEIKKHVRDFEYLKSRAVFLLDLPGRKRYLSPVFKVAGRDGQRLDFHIYRPVNEEAEALKDRVGEMLKYKFLRHVWTGHNVVVLDNWKMIHAREDSSCDKKRSLKRIYINELV